MASVMRPAGEPHHTNSWEPLLSTRPVSKTPARTRLAADIGGTFTDVAAFDEKTGRMLLGKSLSTPQDMVQGITHGVDKAGTQYSDAALFLHGSTVAINTMLERTGARTALITTEGFRDVYEIGRVNRPDAFNLAFRRPRPLIERDHVYEVPERLRADGTVVTPLDEDAVRALAGVLRDRGYEAVGVRSEEHTSELQSH